MAPSKWGWGSYSKPSPMGAHWPLVVLDIMAESVGLVSHSQYISFSFFLHDGWSERPHPQKLIEWGPGLGSPGLLQGSSWLLWQMPGLPLHSRSLSIRVKCGPEARPCGHPCTQGCCRYIYTACSTQ